MGLFIQINLASQFFVRPGVDWGGRGMWNIRYGFLLARLMDARPDRPLFLLHAWPDVVSAVESLVEELLSKKSSARNVRKAMEKLCQAMATFVDPGDASAGGRGGR